ncbi:uncharacterized protein LOC114361118 [Ostrinia furnacalis]|uniref:uncharacterized protein LOC114361118 n=1 Tax=Ostrinia furnacalis TaxID=93504 RepID=UPI00103F6873|nr:uncharacterized protein LOC114361118 [Ostrinia furnacalis]
MRAAAPLCASSHGPLRVAALSLLPAVADTCPAWGNRRGGAWGGSAHAAAILRAAAPLCASSHGPLRAAALSLLPKLLPAVADTRPGLEAILECLESRQPEVAASALDALPELACAAPEHAGSLLRRTFALALASRLPAESALARTVAALNTLRGC